MCMISILQSLTYPIKLFLDSPVCQPSLKTSYRVAREETVKIVCEVDASPADVSTFRRYVPQNLEYRIITLQYTTIYFNTYFKLFL